MITPWGMSDYKFDIEPGLCWVSTPSHGGFMASLKWAELHLSQEARAEGERFGLFLAFEEDCACNVVIFEHPTPRYQELFTSTTLDEIYNDTRRAIANWMPIYALRRDLEVNRDRAYQMVNEGWYCRSAELAELLALTA